VIPLVVVLAAFNMVLYGLTAGTLLDFSSSDNLPGCLAADISHVKRKTRAGMEALSAHGEEDQAGTEQQRAAGFRNLNCVVIKGHSTSLCQYPSVQ
jgi:hypothetical protein